MVSAVVLTDFTANGVTYRKGQRITVPEEQYELWSGQNMIGPTGGSDMIGPTGGSDMIGPTGGSDMIGPTSGGDMIGPTDTDD